MKIDRFIIARMQFLCVEHNRYIYIFRHIFVAVLQCYGRCDAAEFTTEWPYHNVFNEFARNDDGVFMLSIHGRIPHSAEFSPLKHNITHSPNKTYTRPHTHNNLF